MDTSNSMSCETILSLIKATNIISSKLTIPRNLNESLENIFSHFKDIDIIKKAWVFSNCDNESFSNIYAFNDENTKTAILPENELYPILYSQKYDLFDIKLISGITSYIPEKSDLAFVFPSIINKEVMASSIAVLSVSEKDVETIAELLDIVFSKIGSIIARIDYEKTILEQQNNLNNLLAGIDDMLFVVNESGRIIHFNNSAQRTLGYNEEELSSMSLFNLKREEDVQKTVEELRNAKEKGSMISYIPFVSVTNRAIPVETTISKGLWNSKPILILIVRNLTDFENARNEIVLARLKAEDANNAKSQFLRKMSHQFRVPLNSILGMTELLMKTDMTKKQFNFLNIILRSTENLMGILNDILDFNKIENNEISLEKKCYNLKDVIQLVMNTGYHSTQSKGVELLSNYGKYGEDVFLKGDSLRLFQVLMNMVQFCAAETQIGKVEIGIEIDRTDNKKTKLLFRVTDTSEGLNEEELEELRKNIGSSRHDFLYRHAGSGLGLSISWHLVKLMGGELEINSNKNGNSFELAIYQDLCSKEEISAGNETETNQGHDLSKNFRILLAEDQVFNQMVIQAMVEDWGLTIDIAENGNECLKMLSENKNYNLVLMDIQMPLMDGIEATQKIRNEFPSPVSEIPIIAITAHAYADEHRKFLAAGMNDTITKPFRSQILFQKIANCLGISRTDMSLSENQADIYPIGQTSETTFDLTVVRSITKGNIEAFNKMINVFIEKSNEEMANLKEAIKNRNWELLTNTAHKMKPALAYMGMKLLEQEVNSLYHLSKNQPDEEILKNIVNSVEKRLINVCERLKQETV